MKNLFIVLLAGAGAGLLFILLKFGTIDPCGIVRAEVRQAAERAGGFGGVVAAALPDSVIDSIIAAQYGPLSPGRCISLAFEGAPLQAPAPTYQSTAPPNSVAAPYITSDCHQGDCARYYLVKTFPSPPSAYPPFSTDQYLAHVKAIGYCNPGVLDCAKGEYVAGDQGIEIYNVRCSEPGYIRVGPAFRIEPATSIEEPNPQPSHATLVSDAIWKKVCGR